MLDLPHTATILTQKIRWGKYGTGPALIAIHGTPFSAQVWRRIIPHLCEHWTVYYYDLAGYGHSEMRTGQDVSLGIQNEILAGLIQEWGLTRPHILAHDFGGATALRELFINGLDYASLTLFDAVALAPWGSPFVQHVRQHETAFSQMPAYMHEALLKSYLQTAAYQPLSDESLEIYSQPWRGKTGQAAFYRQISQMDQKYTDVIENLYRPLSCPVHVLWGEQDDWIPIKQGHKLVKKISDRPLTPIAGAGHLVQEDCPEVIVAAMLGRNLNRE